MGYEAILLYRHACIHTDMYIEEYVHVCDSVLNAYIQKPIPFTSILQASIPIVLPIHLCT